MSQLGDDELGLKGFIRTVFGKSRDDVWRELSEQIGAEFLEGAMFDSSLVQARSKDWIITMDVMSGGGETSNYHTRFRAPYVNPDGIRFTLSNSNLFKELGKVWFGTQDIEVGHHPFDQKFIIQGNRPAAISELLADPRLQELALLQKQFFLTVKDDEGWFNSSFPDGVDELYCHIPGVVKDLPRLRDLFELFSIVLNHLCHEGRAYDDDVELYMERLRFPGGQIKSRVLLWDGDPPRREAAIALGQSGDPRAIESLAEALEDDDVELRALAMKALGTIGHPDAVPYIVPFLGHEAPTAHGSLRRLANEVLRGLGQSELVEAFNEAIAGRPDGLRAYGGPLRGRIIQGLVYSLVMGVPTGVRVHAVRALATLGATEALPILRKRVRLTGKSTGYGMALRETITQLESWASLPRPAEGVPSSHDVETLPSPAGEPKLTTDTLPRSVDSES